MEKRRTLGWPRLNRLFATREMIANRRLSFCGHGVELLMDPQQAIIVSDRIGANRPSISQRNRPTCMCPVTKSGGNPESWTRITHPRGSSSGLVRLKLEATPRVHGGGSSEECLDQLDGQQRASARNHHGHPSSR